MAQNAGWVEQQARYRYNSTSFVSGIPSRRFLAQYTTARDCCRWLPGKRYAVHGFQNRARKVSESLMILTPRILEDEPRTMLWRTWQVEIKHVNVSIHRYNNKVKVLVPV